MFIFTKQTARQIYFFEHIYFVQLIVHSHTKPRDRRLRYRVDFTIFEKSWLVVKILVDVMLKIRSSGSFLPILSFTLTYINIISIKTCPSFTILYYTYSLSIFHYIINKLLIYLQLKIVL